ncbi:hypothetical protein SKAU_G00036560 [Synaphobranchus kaupii]|uniref:Tetraspanin-33 n=1 Tax=Synaphobranchus kaupii TaxID=118154 RepID=A0A9Q1GG80_SYNKA|nr:hypothetical protein SKAU_G00036560 [Synaphobranchus kaupii]
MKMQYHIVIVVILWSTVLVDSRKIRGISLAYRRFYKEKKSFLCIDGSKIIPFEQVNDDYCDCPDGSDEPGTSACTNGRFYCINLGFRPHYIQSSRVNDGICDCCDGSDEYNSRMRCHNTCRDLGQRAQVEVEDQMRAVNEGLHLKQQLIKEGINIWQEKQSQLRDLQRVSEELRTKLEAHRKRKRKAEGMMGFLKPQGTDPRKKKGPESPADFFHELDCDKDGSITFDEVQSNVVNRGEEGRVLTEQEAVALLGGSRQADLSRFQETLWRSLKSDGGVKIKDDPRSQVSTLDEDPNIKAAENDSADLKKIEEAYDTVRLEIRDLEETLSMDYGANKEFMYLQSRCVELTVYDKQSSVVRAAAAVVVVVKASRRCQETAIPAPRLLSVGPSAQLARPLPAARGKVTEIINNAILHYRDDLDLQNLIDFGQKEFACCGGITYTDWTQNLYFNCTPDNPSRERCSVPYSCCLQSNVEVVINTMCGQGMQSLDYGQASAFIHTSGCIDTLVNWIHSNLFLLGGIALGLAIPQLVGMLLSQTLINQIKDQIELQDYNHRHRSDPWR